MEGAPWVHGLARYRGRPGLAMIVRIATDSESDAMTTTLRRFRTALSSLVPEDRPGFKRVDASPARSDDGAWLESKR